MFRAPRMLALVEQFRQTHLQLTTALDRADASSANTAQLLEVLRGLRAPVLEHLQAKDAFYPALATHLMDTGDAAGAQLARIFEQNMKIQSGAVQRFFEGLDRAAPQALVESYKTVATVLRQRFVTEERAVFPLTVRKEPRGGRR